MRPTNSYDEPLRVTAIDEDVVFLGILGSGPVNFSMTRGRPGRRSTISPKPYGAADVLRHVDELMAV